MSENEENHPSTDKQVQQRVIEEMGHISSELAHDLRSPLQTIQNAIYLIQRNPDNEQLYVMVKQSLQQATSILDNFREYYKGHILQRLQVDPVKVVELSFSELEIPENIKILKDYQETEPINIDPAKTALALRKLLQNALEAMPEGGELSVKVVDEHDWVTILINDTGSGISDDLADVIDTPFMSGKKKGKGLGIPTAKRIIESHGGEMSYTSESGVGTTWEIRLPRAAVNL
ncbi:MAG: HAMP domain-containing histidine kinase [Candidatus Bathyarchaeota archaeon]|nr:HAMP domain-containing histidine kinase [Candidatus Bathyarchaeota archaeon]